MAKFNKDEIRIFKPVKRASVASRHPESGGAFAVWGTGGVGPLMRRVQRELEQALRRDRPKLKDKPFNHFVTRPELAHLLDCYGDWPLPLELRCILILELRGKRKGRPGPKITRSDWDYIQDVLLLSHYEQGLVRGKTLRLYLQLRESKQTRSAKPYIIPTARARACRYVRNWLPKFRDMTDASIANLVSQQRANNLALERQLAERDKSSLNSRQE